ncbi:MAG: YcaO-like family protein [Deltaproteobacteria bacterium]|nr:YcaO-like family protein [Deltaproteobacteria bacterium]
MMYSAELEELCAAFPLSKRWLRPELYADRIRIGGASLDAVGLSAETADGKSATGSAAQVDGSPLRRAYFELLERTAVLDALSGAIEPARWPLSAAFPENPQPQAWRYSLSNGVAAQLTFGAARESAELELIERDRILRCWRAGVAPELLPIFEERLRGYFAGLHELYEPAAFSFGVSLRPPREPVFTAGVFAFPTGDAGRHPFVYGFGARRSLALAVEAAARECLQRLAFLWGEDWTGELPAFSPTADFHQEYYLRQPGIDAMRRWLFASPPLRESEAAMSLARDEPQYYDLTPEHLRGKISVVRAVSPEVIPLYFGRRAGYGEGLHPVS